MWSWRLLLSHLISKKFRFKMSLILTFQFKKGFILQSKKFLTSTTKSLINYVKIPYYACRVHVRVGLRMRLVAFKDGCIQNIKMGVILNLLMSGSWWRLSRNGTVLCRVRKGILWIVGGTECIGVVGVRKSLESRISTIAVARLLIL